MRTLHLCCSFNRRHFKLETESDSLRTLSDYGKKSKLDFEELKKFSLTIVFVLRITATMNTFFVGNKTLTIKLVKGQTHANHWQI
jgi:hypothetical protein